MKLLITGLNGTLAPRVAELARQWGAQVVAWNRQVLDPEDLDAGRAWLDTEQLSAIAHLATGSVAWASRLSEFAGRNRLPFLFSSSAMVFHHEPDGPHEVAAERNAQDEYGRYKVSCEDAILDANPSAMIVRIGWQIDADQTGNNMLHALDGWQLREGCVSASRCWRPACSFMKDTAAAFIKLLHEPRPGAFHFDSNSRDGHSFAQIAQALKIAFNRDSWQIREHDEYIHDQRLLGGELEPPPLVSRLPQLEVHRELPPSPPSAA